MISGAASVNSQAATSTPSGNTTSPSSSQLPSGLILRWSFDSSTISGNMVTDLSGSNMNGTIQGNVKVITGQSGQALQFNGTNSSVQNYAAAPFTSNLTLSAWINTTNAARDEAIIARYDAAGPGTGYIFRTDANGHLEMVFGAYNGGSISSPLVDTAIVNDGRWHHVAAVITLGKGVQFYVDGNATANVPAKISALDSGVFNVGMNSYTPFGNYFTGTIDEVQVYNRALASNEISTVYAFSGGQAANTQTSTSTGSTGSTSVSGTPGSNNGTTQGGSGTTTTQTQGSGSSAQPCLLLRLPQPLPQRNCLLDSRCAIHSMPPRFPVTLLPTFPETT